MGASRAPAEGCRRSSAHEVRQHVRRIPIPLTAEAGVTVHGHCGIETGEPLLPYERRNAKVQRPCGACHPCVLIVTSWPRPTIAQIMQMPLEQLQQYQLPFQ